MLVSEVQTVASAELPNAPKDAAGEDMELPKSRPDKRTNADPVPGEFPNRSLLMGPPSNEIALDILEVCSPLVTRMDQDDCAPRAELHRTPLSDVQTVNSFDVVPIPPVKEECTDPKPEPCTEIEVEIASEEATFSRETEFTVAASCENTWVKLPSRSATVSANNLLLLVPLATCKVIEVSSVQPVASRAVPPIRILDE
eukprot:1804152-Rhodomonas_salina.1